MGNDYSFRVGNNCKQCKNVQMITNDYFVIIYRVIAHGIFVTLYIQGSLISVIYQIKDDY